MRLNVALGHRAILSRSARLTILALMMCGALAANSVPRAFAQAAEPLSRDAVLRDAEIPALGNPQGDITVVEWFDYQCPYCKNFSPELARLVREDGKIRLVMKDWPILGPSSDVAARLVLAARYQDKYEQSHQALMATRGRLTETTIRDTLSKAGVDIARADADAESHRSEIDSLLKRNSAQAEAFGFQGTPAFIIGTFRVPGILDAANFKHAIADARALAAKPSK